MGIICFSGKDILYKYLFMKVTKRFLARIPARDLFFGILCLFRRCVIGFQNAMERGSRKSQEKQGVRVLSKAETVIPAKILKTPDSVTFSSHGFILLWKRGIITNE